MDNKKVEVFALVGGAVVLVAIVAMKGQGTTVGATFASANPSSVASVQSAGASEIASINDLTLQKMKTAASTVVALAQLQSTLDATRLGVGANEYSTANQTLQVGLQTDSANYLGGVLSSAQTQQAALNAQAATAQAQIGATAAAQAAQIAANAQVAATQINAGVQTAALGVAKDISNNQTTQARIGKSTSFGDIFKTAVGGALSYFSGGTSSLLGGGAKAAAPAPIVYA